VRNIFELHIDYGTNGKPLKKRLIVGSGIVIMIVIVILVLAGATVPLPFIKALLK
jgi:hypothetical protein